MIITFGTSRELKSALETVIADAVVSGDYLSEAKLSKIFNRHQGYSVIPAWDFSRARKSWGWDSSTLRYFAKIDEHSCQLPESSPLFIKDIKKGENGEELVNCKKLDLLRELNKIEIQVNKIRKLIEEGEE